MEKQQKKEMLNCIRECINIVVFNQFLSFMNFNKNEKIVLEMLYKQCSYQEIADELHYSYRQIQRIVNNIINKTNKIIDKLDEQSEEIKEVFHIIF